jgi:acyl carrier protein
MSGRQQIFDDLARLLRPFNRNDVEITPGTDIAADLHIDSVAVMDFVMEVEDHFDIEIPLNVLSEIRTMEELVTVVETRTKRSEVA